MNYFDDELKIIESFQTLNDEEVCFPKESKSAIELYKSIHGVPEWRCWKHSNGKNDPPPDFYCEQQEIMMDIMRVDDHAYKNDKGQVINRVNAEESIIQNELSNTELITHLYNVDNILVNAVTDLPTEKDHNYKYYKNNFKDIVSKHIDKIPLYNNNHPNYKVVLFVCDESSAYFKSFNNRQVDKKSEIIDKPHLFFADDDLVKVFINSQIDFLIWFAPFKLLQTTEGVIPLPKAIIYDLEVANINTIKYEEDMMVSSEL